MTVAQGEVPMPHAHTAEVSAGRGSELHTQFALGGHMGRTRLGMICAHEGVGTLQNHTDAPAAARGQYFLFGVAKVVPQLRHPAVEHRSEEARDQVSSKR